MIQPIMHDPLFLAQKSAPATPEDAPIARDLLETLTAHADGCVGMAANMIGEAVRIIVLDNEGEDILMFNPEILKREGEYQTEEGCLSLEGTRKTARFRKIRIRYQNEAFQTRIKTFQGFTAQIIQHECDHLEGIII